MAVLQLPITIAAVAALSMSIAGCSKGGRDVPPPRETAVVIKQDTAPKHKDTLQSAGEVVSDSAAAPVTGIWITDGNALSLFGVMNSREIGAANRELERYRSDTVRVFAEAMLHEHAAMQRGVDSVAAVTRIAPIASALAVPIGVMMQAQTDLVQGVRGAALDRAFVRQQIAAHELMAAYIDQLGAVAQRPEVQGFMKSALSRVRSHLQRAQALDSLLAVADSVATADSAAKASLRAKRQSPDR